jgi:hypothetical protein
LEGARLFEFHLSHRGDSIGVLSPTNIRMTNE